MPGQILVLERKTFVAFFQQFYSIPADKANIFFSAWALFLIHAQIRAQGSDSTKDALAQHLVDVINNKEALLKVGAGNAVSYKKFVESLSPQLHYLMKKDYALIDNSILLHEQERLKSKSKRSPIESVSVDISKNSEKPTYERGIELLQASGYAINRRFFQLEGVLGNVGQGISDWFGNTTDKTLVETGFKDRDTNIVIPSMTPTSATPPPVAKTTSAAKSYALSQGEVDDPAFQLGFERSPIKLKTDKSVVSRPGTKSGSGMKISFEREVSNGDTITTETEIFDSEYPILEFVARSRN